MRLALLLVFSLVLCSLPVHAQGNKVIIIRAGTKVTDYFPIHERYLYTDFLPGRIVFRNGSMKDLQLNYNILLGEIEFLQTGDTLAIASSRKKDISYVVARDTFYYAGGYIQELSGGQLKVGLKQYVKVKDVLKKGAYGTTSRGASVDTYTSMSSSGISYDLIPNEDIEVQKEIEYYISFQSGGFDLFTKKNVIQLFPEKSEEIKSYIKSKKVDFSSREDLLKFADYLRAF
jgi:hypothetical protein